MSRQIFNALVIQLKVMSDEEAAIFLNRKVFQLLHYMRHLKFAIYITEKRIKYIEPTAIIYAKAHGSYTMIHYLKNGLATTHLITQNIGSLEFELRLCGLIKVHRSHMVQPKYVDEFDTEGEFILLTDGTKLEIPREKIHYVKVLLKSNHQHYSDKKPG